MIHIDPVTTARVSDTEPYRILIFHEYIRFYCDLESAPPVYNSAR